MHIFLSILDVHMHIYNIYEIRETKFQGIGLFNCGDWQVYNLLGRQTGEKFKISVVVLRQNVF